MKTITDDAEILDLLPAFSQTVLEEGVNGETVEHGHLSIDDVERKARIIYALPTDGNYDKDSGEFLGNWDDHIIRMEIDD